MNLQNGFLLRLQNERRRVSIYLKHGTNLSGTIEAFDEEVILLTASTTQMIFKHAISSIYPLKREKGHR